MKMTDLRLRDDRGRFTSDAEESATMNAAFMRMCGLQPAPTPEPTQATGAGKPTPLTPGAVLAGNDNENEEMNKALREMCGIYSDSR
jgi:hypothetical protein